MNPNSPVLFESTDAISVLADSANADWLAVVDGIQGELYDLVVRRCYLALSHFRRATMAGRVEVEAANKQEALQALLKIVERLKTSPEATEANESPQSS